jgi:hypothetical protein
MPPMMSDQNLHTARLGFINQSRRSGRIIRNRLFNQHWNACANTRKRLFNMKLVGRRQDDPIRAMRRNVLLKVSKPNRAMRVGQVLRPGVRVHNSRKPRTTRHNIHMCPPDQTGSYDRNRW